MTKLFILLLLLPFFLIHSQPTKQCSTYTVDPSATCNYCNINPIINIGANSSSVIGNQVLNVGNYSRIVNVGYFTHTLNLGPEAVRINLGISGTATLIYIGNLAISATTQQLNVGVGSNTVNIATLSTTITVGQITPTPTPTSDIEFGTYNRNILIGGYVRTLLAIAYQPTAGPVTICRSSPTASPGQDCVIGDFTSNLLLGRGALNGVSIGTYNTAGNIAIGNTVASPTTQDIIIGQRSRDIYISQLNTGVTYFAHETTSRPVYFGQANPSPSPTQDLFIGAYSRNIYMGEDSFTSVVIGTRSPLIRMGTDQTSAKEIRMGFTPSGAPSSSSSRIKLNGLYHYSYSASCRTVIAGPLLQCIDDVQTNGPTGTSGTSGYISSDARYYPPEVGHYTICVTVLADASGTNMLVRIRVNGAVFQNLYRSANTAFLTVSTCFGYKFDSVGVGQYIDMEATAVLVSANEFAKFYVVRTA